MKFIAGMITSTIFIAIMFIACWLYFDFPISTNDEKQSEPQTQQIQQKEIRKENSQPTQATQPTEQKHNGITPPNNKPERLNNLHDKQKAVELMKSKRYTLSDENKKIYDGVIETAKTNINNGVANTEDYSYLNMYKQFKGGE